MLDTPKVPSRGQCARRLVLGGVGDLFFEVVFVLCDTPEIPSRGQCASRKFWAELVIYFLKLFFLVRKLIIQFYKYMLRMDCPLEGTSGVFFF